MGTPLPLNEPGALCGNCWGPDKPFGPGPTPKFVKVTIRDCEIITPYLGRNLINPNGTWLCPQSPEPCLWRYAFEDTVCLWETHFAYSHLFFQSAEIVLFTAFYIPTCQSFFINDYYYPDETLILGGSGIVTWSTDGL